MNPYKVPKFSLILFCLNAARRTKKLRLIQYAATFLILLAYKYSHCRLFQANGQHVSSNQQFPIRIGNSQFDSVYRKDFRQGYEIEIQLFIDSQRSGKQDSGLFVDVGSNWGHHSFDALLSGNFRVQAFDANPEVCNDFMRVAKSLGCTNRVKIDSYAITNINGGYASFKIPILKSGMASTNSLHLECGISESRSTVLLKKILNLHDPLLKVPCRTLDSMNLNDVKVIKIDIEGSDLECLDGARLTIKEQLPAITIEWQKDYSTQPDSKGILDFLSKQGYNFYRLEKRLSGYVLARVAILEIRSRENLFILRPEHFRRFQRFLSDVMK